MIRVAAGVMALAAVVSACGSGGSKSSGAVPATAVARSTAGGASLVVATNFLPSSADPDPKNPSDAEFASVVSTNLGGTLFSHLGASTDPATAATVQAPGMELADSASTSSDGLTVTVHLRPHVLSQWGNALTADDVVWTMQRVENTNLYGALLLKAANVDATNPATASGPLTVTFHLTKPSSIFQQALSLPFLDILDKQAVLSHAASSDGWGRTWLTSHSASFGPYEIAATDFPSKVMYVANPHYWRGRPSISKATFIVESDDSTRLATVISGAADYAVALNSSDLKTVKSTPSLVAYLQPNAPLLYYLTFDLKNAEVKSLQLRKAVSAAVDRKQMVAIAFNGAATAVTGCLPPNIYPKASASPDNNAAGGNASLAKSLLSGIGSAPSVTVGYLTSAQTTAMAEIIEQNLTTVGIKVTLKPYSSYSVFSADQASAKFGIGIDGFGPFIPTAAYIFNNLLVSTSGENAGSYANPAVDAATATALSTGGARQQSALATDCAAQMTDVPITMLGSVDTVSAYSSRITKVSSAGQIPLLYNMRVK